MKKILFPALALIMTVTIAVSACAAAPPDTSDGNDDKEFTDNGDINTLCGLEISKALNRKNGKYVNLYVENQGTNSVVATINGQSERTFEPDESGSISVEVTQGWFGSERDYVFKVVAGPNGGRVNIQYEIAQQDSQDS